jgi:hypothetical protein
MPPAVENVAGADVAEETNEDEPAVLFVVYGTHLIPAICSVGGGPLERGADCLAHLGPTLTVRLSSDATATAHRSSFECGPTEETTQTYELGEAVPDAFAVTPETESTARSDRQPISRDIADDHDGNAVFAAGNTSTVDSTATSDLDGDGKREAVVVYDYGHGLILSIARPSTGHKTELLFSWECGS